jgi:hypothetical protein
MVPSGYKEDKVYSVVPSDGSGDMAFTRASNGTRVNSAGLVEVVPWNLIDNSQNFNAGNWYQENITPTTGQSDPLGANNAFKFLETATTGEHYFFYLFLVQPELPITQSIYVKSAGRDQISFGAVGMTNNFIFTFSTGVISSVTGFASTSATSVGNGWYRLTATFTASSPTNLLFVKGYNGGLSYAGDTAKGFYAFGGQLNIGSTAKPYFPTTDRLNVPRLTYQNGGGGCPSLLLEKQSTNEASYSEQFDNAYWTKQGLTVTANSIVSPDGTQNADLLTLNTSTTEHNVYAPASGLAITSNAPFTFSCYVKKGTGRYFCVATYFTGVGFGPYATFDLNTATLVASGASFGTYSSSKIENMGNDWYRCSVTGFGPYTSLIFAPDIRSASSLIPGVPFTGAGETMYLWGAQLEASSHPTSYIPTTSSSATRVADACFKTGISSLIGQTEGTIFVDLVYNGSEAQTGNIFSFDQSTSGSVVIIRNSNGSIGSAVWDGSAKAVFNGGSMPIGQRTKIAYAYKSGSTALFVNGVQIGSDSGSTFTLPTISQIYLNSVTAYFAFQQSASFNEAVIFPTRLTNAELAQLTA